MKEKKILWLCLYEEVTDTLTVTPAYQVCLNNAEDLRKGESLYKGFRVLGFKYMPENYKDFEMDSFVRFIEKKFNLTRKEVKSNISVGDVINEISRFKKEM